MADVRITTGQNRAVEIAVIVAVLALSNQTGVTLAEVGFLLILFAGVWLMAAQIAAFKMHVLRAIVAGRAQRHRVIEHHRAAGRQLECRVIEGSCRPTSSPQNVGSAVSALNRSTFRSNTPFGPETRTFA
jgi:uncharacterized integral membrane protein